MLVLRFLSQIRQLLPARVANIALEGARGNKQHILVAVVSQ